MSNDRHRKGKGKVRRAIPALKRKASLFLRSEEGKLAKGQAAMAASSLLLLGAAMPSEAEAVEPAPPSGATPDDDGLVVSPEVNPQHCSHASHGSHGSHASHGSHGSHASHGSHGSHASHGSHGQW